MSRARRSTMAFCALWRSAARPHFSRQFFLIVRGERRGSGAAGAAALRTRNGMHYFPLSNEQTGNDLLVA